MATFLSGNGLNHEIERLIESAKEKLILISPYLKLHERYVSSLKAKKNNPNLELIVVFGKNEHDLSKSITLPDFNFFKEFPNVMVCYEKRLHAKYYANEEYSIITSMNLYNYSQDKNIEVGVMTKTNFANKIISTVSGGNDLDEHAWNYFQRVISQAEVRFRRVPKYEPVVFGLSKRYLESVVMVDTLSDFFARKSEREKDYSVHIESAIKVGYCIRTGKKIPFNPNMPMCEEAHSNWSRFNNPDYKEKYCHYSGEPSNGETTFKRPILEKYYRKVKGIRM